MNIAPFHGDSVTFWINYVWFTRPPTARTGARPLLLHRWGGLGNHRYQVGFSGDVHPSWDSLKFQIPFTTSAANVGFGFWSHDIGGHTNIPNAELYTRWVQWGVFSPMFRPHATKMPGNYREFWRYPTPNFDIMHEFVNLRARMLPYIYTEAARAHRTGVSVVSPLYYDYPKHDEAYSFTGQYLFGSQMMVAPITAAMDTRTELATSTIWVPPGCWIDWRTGVKVDGDGTQVSRASALHEIPVYVKCGAIIPMLHNDHRPLLGSAGWLPDVLSIEVVGAVKESHYELYEDAGNDEDYDEHSASTKIHQSLDGKTWTITVDPVTGSYKGMPEKRDYEVVLRFTIPPVSVQLSSGEQANWWYDGNTLSTHVWIESVDTSKGISITVNLPSVPDDVVYGGKVGMLRKFGFLKAFLDTQWASGLETLGRAYQEDYSALVDGSTLATVLSQSSTDVHKKLSVFDDMVNLAVTEIGDIEECPVVVVERTACLQKDAKAKVLAWLKQ